MTAARVGIIGGSGLYQMDELTDAHWEQIDSPFGAPSDALLCGRLGGQEVAFLPRHGRGHRVPPTDLNVRANIDVLKRAGCTQILSFTAVGSLREELPPGTFTVIDQYIDRTFARTKTFFGPGFTAHVSMADPVCGRLGDLVTESARKLSIPNHRGGTYVVMEGPQFSTRAESELYRSWGASIIGMTAMPEAKLAREAEMCFVTIAMVTDYDCWHVGHEAVTAQRVAEVMTENVTRARSLIRDVVPRLGEHRTLCERGCHTALEGAVMTAPEAYDPSLVRKLDAVCSRFFDARKG
ncbi:S-methyl-5'-thioadenosine phosphorylase [Pendulispora albinea]|uniref:S-methyl-5'-thioadenosine phosphorylase n=1 Tax=Pendulispora albinea TaxID=2741071 RepID=A0ABZ2M2C0_9BACT